LGRIGKGVFKGGVAKKRKNKKGAKRLGLRHLEGNEGTVVDRGMV